MNGPTKISLARIAWRNLWRNRRRTLITLSSFAFGMLLAIVFTGMGDDSYSRMIELAARSGSGHVSIQEPTYNDLPSLKKSIRVDSKLLEVVAQEPLTKKAVLRISGMTMLASGPTSVGAAFMALDPTAEDASTLALVDAIKEGEMFAADDPHGLVLGAALAENLGVEIGRRVVYNLTDKHGEFVAGLGRVRGIIRTGSTTVDSAFVLLPLAAVQKLVGYEADEVTTVAVFANDHRGAERLANSLRDDIPSSMSVLTWRETQPDLAGFIAIDQGSNFVFQIIILVLIAAGIFNSLFVSVLERVREFGIMLALGFSPGQISRLVMWESLWLGIVGVLVSAALTAGPYYYLSTVGIDFSDMLGSEGYEVAGIGMDPVVYVHIFGSSLMMIVGISLAVTLLAGIYPAWKASRVEPVESIKLV